MNVKDNSYCDQYNVYFNVLATSWEVTSRLSLLAGKTNLLVLSFNVSCPSLGKTLLWVSHLVVTIGLISAV